MEGEMEAKGELPRKLAPEAVASTSSVTKEIDFINQK